MEPNVREARRRKIIERGTDRLALITGRNQPLPSSSSQSSSLSRSVPPPPLVSQDEVLQNHISDPDSVSPQGQYNAPNPSSLETSNLSLNSDIIETRTGEYEPQFSKYETSESSAMDAPSTVQNLPNSTVDNELHAHQNTHHHRFFTAKQISSSISASENIRIVCAVTIALLVVISHIRYFPLLDNNIIKGIITFRPLNLVLLSNVTIVLAWLVLEKSYGKNERGSRREEEPKEEYDWAEGLGKALERGLVLHKALNAAFMDCSVYAVVVICGLALVKQ